MRVCVAALIVQSQQILLGTHSPDRAFYPDVWDVFGDYVETGESHEQARQRALAEELGLAFTIPENQFADAVAWLHARVDHIAAHAGHATFMFRHWDAEASYFFDPAGNLGELSAHNTCGAPVSRTRACRLRHHHMVAPFSESARDRPALLE